MHKTLILKAFEKADQLRKKQGSQKPSLITKAEDLSEFVEKETGFSLGEKSFRVYRKKAEELKNSDSDININQQKVVNALLSYLEFKTYNDFIKELKTKENKQNGIYNFFLNYKLAITSIALIIILIVFYKSLNTQRWMIWNGENYVEVNFDTEKYKIGELKLYNEDRILNFHKARPNCEYAFFKGSGEANLWYGKNEYGNLEYFTSTGKHPITGKTLKEITNYMVKKHICP
ncbi:hypothetical protein GCM10022291_24620 [Postechiella marina]|uniref:Uncharacterized protein n=1 Tax=Postechiella marina TaxID=943941 RepID=A0ABP8CD29_9FLAO